MGVKPYFFSDSFLDFQTHFWIFVFYWIFDGVQYSKHKIMESFLSKMGRLRTTGFLQTSRRTKIEKLNIQL